MRFMMIMYPGKWAERGLPTDPKVFDEMIKYNETLGKAGVLLALDGLHPTSKGARVFSKGAKRTVTDGPFTESKEIVGGFWMIQVKSKEEAVEWASRIPIADDDMIEVRQVIELDEAPTEVQEAVLLARKNTGRV
jgi:hypothetical protein